MNPSIERTPAPAPAEPERAPSAARPRGLLRAFTPETIAYVALVILGLVLRLKGIHSPLLDHPGWRQGDTAAIARNFATLDYNPFHPQADYDGPPPNYVELELQILPFLAATLYKIFGVHEIFGRLIGIGFGLGTIVVAGRLAAFLFSSARAGIAAAAVYTILPGAIYYSRTFMPDTTMVFFLTLAVYAFARFLYGEGPRTWRALAWPCAAAAVAILAKPVALVLLVPVVAMWVERRGLSRSLRDPQLYAALAVVLLPFTVYDRYVGSIAEWRWASEITRKHVLPGLATAFSGPGPFVAKLEAFRRALGMLRTTMIGTPVLVFFAGAILWWPLRPRSRALLYGWLAAALAYAFIVVTVEPVDYYLYLVLPLAAVWSGGLAGRLWDGLPALARTRQGRPASVPLLPLRLAAGATLALVLALVVICDRASIAPYYHYDRSVYRSAVALNATLPHTLVVMGHLDPSILYYMNRKGWQEDAYLWTPFDEQSAIRKGSRAFVDVERNRLKRNVELSAWLERFPVANPDAKWPVYLTDPERELPGAEARWRRFRDLEKAHALPVSHAPKPPPSAGVLPE